MDSRDLLSDTAQIRFLLDAASLKPALSGSSSPLRKLLYHRPYADFDFLRSDHSSGHEIIDTVHPFQVIRREEGNIEVKVDEDKNLFSSSQIGQITEISKHTDFDDPVPSEYDLRLIEVLDLIASSTNHPDLIVTKNEALLANRQALDYEFKNHYVDRLHIMSPREAAEFAGIWMRDNQDLIFHADYDRAGVSRFSLSGWNTNLSTILVSHLDQYEYMPALRDRLDGVFIGIDQIGNQYYRGTDGYTNAMTRYHFNNCVALLTGIGDTLALHTRDLYDIDIEDKHTTIRMKESLVKALRGNNEKAWTHIEKNHRFFDILHILRNNAIHNKGVISPGPGYFSHRSPTTSDWSSHTIKLGSLSDEKLNEFREKYEQMSDSAMKYDPGTEWGVIIDDGSPKIDSDTRLEPYRFIKRATKEMVKFTDEYLRLLGHSDNLSDLSDTGHLSKWSISKVVDQGLFPLILDVDYQSIPFDRPEYPR